MGDNLDRWQASAPPPTPTTFSTWAEELSRTVDGHSVGSGLNIRATTPADWLERVFSTDAVGAPATAISIEHGRIVLRGSGGTATRTNRRTVLQIPGSPGGYSCVRSRLLGDPDNPAVPSSIPQRGHAHGLGLLPNGTWSALIVWHDILFNQGQLLNLGGWSSETAPEQVGAQFVSGTIIDQANVTAAARSSNVVTLTVPTGHGFARDDVIVVDLADNSYDGTFTVTSVTGTQIVYNQVAANAGTTTGTVRLSRVDTNKTALIRSTAVTALARTSGVVTATVAAGHPWNVGDKIAFDAANNAYDGIHMVTGLPSTTQIQWRQAGSDLGTSTGTISNMFPYYLDTMWTPGRLWARVWRGDAVAPPPPWESLWGVVADITTMAVAEPDPKKALGCGLVMAHPSGSGATFPTTIAYDSVSTAPAVGVMVDADAA